MTSSSFLKNLRFWVYHCFINALPSFLIAGIYLNYFQSVSATLAMLTGVLIFIFSYTFVFTLVPRFGDPQSRLAHALALALKFRFVLMVFGLLCVPMPVFFFLHPDYYAGMGAFWIQKMIYEVLVNTMIYAEGMTSFFDILLWTLLEGILLTAVLFVLSFSALLFVRKVKRPSSPV